MSRVKSTVYGKVEAGASGESTGERSGVWAAKPQPDPGLIHPLALVCAFLFGILLSSQVFLPFQPQTTNAELRITARISAGNAIEVYVNNVYDRSYRAKIDPGERSKYLFQKLPGKITSLRIDPTDVNGAEVEIESIEFENHKQEPQILLASEINQWAKNQLASEGTGATGVLRSNGNDPWLIGNGLSFSTPQVDASWAEWMKGHGSLVLSLCLLGYLFVGRSGYRFGIPIVLALVGIHFLESLISQCLVHQEFSFPDIRHAVGYAAYVGYIKRSENITFALSFIAALFLGGMFGPLFSRGVEVASERRRAFGAGAFFLLCVVFMVSNFPPFATLEAGLLKNSLEVSGFDWGNVFTWNYLAQYGFLPFKDFWFPYGGDALQLGSFPEAQWGIYLVRSILFAIILYGLLELEDQKWIATLFCLGILGLLVEASVFQGTKRYLVSVGLLLFAGGIVRRQSKAITPFLCLGLLVGWCFSREPNQLLYAAPGLLLLAIFHVRQMFEKGWRKTLFAQLGVAFVTSLLVVGTQLLLLFIRGQWQGFVEFYSRMNAMAVSVSVPSPIDQWYEFSLKFENVLLLGIHLLAIGGAFVVFGRGIRGRKVLGLTILGLSFLLALIFFKLLLRPHMAQQMLAGLFIGASLLVSAWSELWTRGQRLGVAVVCGLGCAQFFPGAFFSDVFAQQLNGARNFPANMSAFINGVSTSREELDRYFDQSRFSKLDNDQKAALHYLNTLEFSRFSQELFVLGDDSYFYVMLKEKPCPYLSFYDGANIDAQKEQLSCVRAAQPRAIIWDYTTKNFDNVPNVVRVPLIFDYVMENYLPDKRFGRFQIFRKRESGESFPWGFWTEVLGAQIELGAIPWMSNVSALKECRQNTPCLEFLQIEADRTPPQLMFEVESNKYSVSWKPLERTRTGHILLDRLWFWNSAKRENATIRLPEGVSVQKKSSESDFLY